MRTIFHVAALAGFACGARHFGRFLSERRKSRLVQKQVEVWEGEGGAVPVHATRTAAQISPASAPPLSPPGVGEPT
jgi:hypothetical protein